LPRENGCEAVPTTFQKVRAAFGFGDAPTIAQVQPPAKKGGPLFEHHKNPIISNI
jgi:hypothetical protein